MLVLGTGSCTKAGSWMPAGNWMCAGWDACVLRTGCMFVLGTACMFELETACIVCSAVGNDLRVVFQNM
jgi:hypothetical protein